MDHLKLTRSWGFPFYLCQNLSTETQTSHFNAQRKSLPEPKASSPSSLHCHPRSFHPPSSRHRAGESSAHRQSLPGSCCNNFHPMSSVKEKTKKSKKTTESTLKLFLFFSFKTKLASPGGTSDTTSSFLLFLLHHCVHTGCPVGGSEMNLPQVLVKTNHIVLAAPEPHWHIPVPQGPPGTSGWVCTRGQQMSWPGQSHDLCPWVTSPRTDLFVRAPKRSGTCGFV